MQEEKGKRRQWDEKAPNPPVPNRAHTEMSRAPACEKGDAPRAPVAEKQTENKAR